MLSRNTTRCGTAEVARARTAEAAPLAHAAISRTVQLMTSACARIYNLTRTAAVKGKLAKFLFAAADCVANFPGQGTERVGIRQRFFPANPLIRNALTRPHLISKGRIMKRASSGCQTLAIAATLAGPRPLASGSASSRISRCRGRARQRGQRAGSNGSRVQDDAGQFEHRGGGSICHRGAAYLTCSKSRGQAGPPISRPRATDVASCGTASTDPAHHHGVITRPARVSP